MRLKDKVAMVTGGARGIGRAIALLFAREGADIAVCDVNSESAESTCRQIEALGRKAIAVKMDVTSLPSVEEGLNKILDKLTKVDILVNNAGITKDALILRMSEQDFDAVINVNLKGTFNCTKAVSKVMIKQRGGAIVNIASIIGIIGNPGQANYSASKAGIIALTKTSAKELSSRNINVNAVAPGFIESKMTEVLPEEVKQKMLEQIPMKRFGVPADVAKAVLFLCAETSAYITGQVLSVNGGMYM